MASIFDQTEETGISTQTLRSCGWEIKRHDWTHWLTANKTIDLYTDHPHWASRYRVGRINMAYHFESPCCGHLLIKFVKRDGPYMSLYGIDQEYVDSRFASVEDKFLDYQIDSLEEMDQILKMVEESIKEFKLYFKKEE